MTTKEAVQVIEDSFLSTEDPTRIMRLVGTALVRILSLQTEDEKVTGFTTEKNGQGFTGIDAEIGTSMAQFFAERGYLSPGQVAVWMKPAKNGKPRILKYRGQLAQFVIAKNQ